LRLYTDLLRNILAITKYNLKIFQNLKSTLVLILVLTKKVKSVKMRRFKKWNVLVI